MNQVEPGLRAAIAALAATETRPVAAERLAALLGVDRLLLYVRDPQLGVMLPAPGMPKTVIGGALWREFLRRCLREARPAGPVDLPPDVQTQAQAVVCDGAALVLLGAAPPEVLDALQEEFPLLAALLVTQQALQIEHGEAATARAAAAAAQDLTQALDRARAASAELNLQLRREHERKDEFLAMLAHELRNPLAPLVHGIELLRRSGSAGDPAGTRHLQVMERQLQQLIRLVDDLLDVSRVSRGLIHLRRERVWLDDVLNDAIDATRPLLMEQGHALERGPAVGVAVHGDRVRLTQVFANLLSNAAKYTERGGRIALSVIVDQRRVSVVVKDTGVGIPQEMLSRIFDMFTQMPRSLDRSAGGLGIGLTLVRRLVELHGGHVSAYSRGEGEGSTFTVSLPQMAAAAVPRRAAPAAPAAPHPATAVAGPRRRVLVVDDNRDAAETMADLLDMLGAEARAAHDGLAALQLAQEFHPDLILLDIGLPGIDGYETARRLRRLPAPHARLVALTGYGSGEDRRRALEAGFDDHLVKPLSAETTLALLAQGEPMHPAS